MVGAVLTADGLPVQIGGTEKMAKSKNNGVDPQQMVGNFGADTVRLFSMFAAPPEQSLDWSEAGVEGMSRFLRRLWNQVQKHVAGGPVEALDTATLSAEQKALRRKLHETIEKVADDYARRYTFNTAIAAVMELVNALMKANADDASAQGRAVAHEAWTAISLMLNPIVPHLCHGLWQALGNSETLIENLPFPKADPAALVRDAVVLAVQVNGKLRGQIEVAVDASRETIEQLALAEPLVQKFLEGVSVRKIIIVPGKIVSIVAN